MVPVICRQVIPSFSPYLLLILSGLRVPLKTLDEGPQDAILVGLKVNILTKDIKRNGKNFNSHASENFLCFCTTLTYMYD